VPAYAVPLFVHLHHEPRSAQGLAALAVFRRSRPALRGRSALSLAAQNKREEDLAGLCALQASSALADSSCADAGIRVAVTFILVESFNV
jgi:hypothetical protein